MDRELSQLLDQTIIMLHKEHYNDTQIAKVCGCHRTLIGQRRKKLGLDRIEVDFVTEERNRKIVELLKSGHSDAQISRELNIPSPVLVRKIRLKMGMPKALTPRQRTIHDMAEAGYKYYEIAEELGEPTKAVRVTLNRLGFSVTDADKDACRNRAIEKITKTVDEINAELRPLGFEYVSGYTGCDAHVIVRCLKCGSEIKRNYNFVRARRSSMCSCPVCLQMERDDKRKAEQAEREKRQALKEMRQIERAKQIELPMAVCSQCGRLFIPQHGKQTLCSDECRRRARSKISNQHKEHRLHPGNIIHKDITLEKLYKRDSGVCYICGRTCDWQDFIVKDGTVICGDNYPSIEHVMPLSKGGLHSWDNVKLACRRCNTLKSDTLPVAEI